MPANKVLQADDQLAAEHQDVGQTGRSLRRGTDFSPDTAAEKHPAFC